MVKRTKTVTHRVFAKEPANQVQLYDWYSCKEKWRPVICHDGLSEWWQLPYSDKEMIENKQVLKIVVSSHPTPSSYKCKKGHLAYFQIQSEEDKKWYLYDSFVTLNTMIQVVAPCRGDVFYLGVELE